MLAIKSDWDGAAGLCASEEGVDKEEPDNDGGPGSDEDEFRQVEDNEKHDLECEQASESGHQPSLTPCVLTQRAAASQQRPHTRLPMWLAENYKATCTMLQEEMGRGSKRQLVCYNNGTFFLPCHNVFFESLKQYQLSPQLFYQPHYFVWIPHLFQQIPCLACAVAGRKAACDGSIVMLWPHSFPQSPHCVIDIKDHIYIISYCYQCGHKDCRKSYQSWSPLILGAICQGDTWRT